MKKSLVKRLLEKPNISEKDLHTFISEYTLQQLGENITAEQLLGISQLIKSGYFNLRYALLQAARSLGLNVIIAYDNNGELLKTHVYESK